MNIYEDVIIFDLLNFYLEMFFAAAVCVRHHRRRTHFWVRLLLCLAVGALTYFVPMGRLAVGPFNFSYLIVFLLIAAQVFACMKISVLGSIFFAVSAFAMQNAAWTTMLLLFELIGMERFTVLGARLLYVGTYAVMYLVMGLIFPTKEAARESRENILPHLLLSAAIVLIVYIVSLVASSYRLWNVFMRIYAIMCSVFALCAQFGFFRNDNLRSENRKLETEKVVLEELLYRDKKWQELSKENIDIITQKCHDLKHQISTLRTMSEEEREVRIGEIEEAINIYGNIAKTKNEVLNVVLTEKSMLCEKYKIRFTYMLGGEELSFFDPVDLSTLLGNALDNAIECVSKEREEYRVIKLNVNRKGDFLGIHVENYCSHKVVFKDGLPVTDKPDCKSHGFGVKSIRYITEKYGGYLRITAKDDLFVLDLLFPLPKH